MRLTPPPASASWNHRGARVGFEVSFFHNLPIGHRMRGHTTANESTVLWSVGYDVVVDNSWRTLTVHATSTTTAGARDVALARGMDDRWTVDGIERPDLDGCIDVDCESSAVTNTLPVHRLDFLVGTGVDVPAAFVRADDLRVERLEQRYTLTEATPEQISFHYESSTFDFECELRYDPSGLIVEYPGIATRDA